MKLHYDKSHDQVWVLSWGSFDKDSPTLQVSICIFILNRGGTCIDLKIHCFLDRDSTSYSHRKVSER